MQCVRYEVYGQVAAILLDRPPVNALTEELLDELIGSLDRAAADDTVRAVILGSAVERRFCAGLDLTAVAGMPAADMRRLIGKLYLGIHDAQSRLGKPSIAAVGGTARGGGMTLAISCDLMVAGRSASFGYPEIDIGVIPAIHYAHLASIAGRHRAFDVLFTGRSFDADDAAALGLVSRIVADARLLDEARALGQVFAGKPREAMVFGRAAFRREVDDGHRDRIARAVENFCAVAGTAEAKARIEAFLHRPRK